MSRALSVVVIVSLFFITGCKTEPDRAALMKDNAGKLKETAELLKGVTDEASAKDALPKLKSLSREVRTIQRAIQKLNDKDPKPATAEQLAIAQDLYAQEGRIVNTPKLSAILQTAIDHFGSDDPRWNKE